MTDYAERHRQEEIREAAWRERLNTIAPQIASGLGDGWKIVIEEERQYHPTVDLSGPSGLLLDLTVIRHGTGRGRLQISGGLNGLHRDVAWADREVKREITVSLDKTPDQIVKAIQGRLLPGYLGVMERARANKVQYDETAARVARVAGEIAARYAKQGGRIVDNTKRAYPGDTVYFRAMPTVHIDSDGDVYFERSFDVPMEKALRILDILAEGK